MHSGLFEPQARARCAQAAQTSTSTVRACLYLECLTAPACWHACRAAARRMTTRLRLPRAATSPGLPAALPSTDIFLSAAQQLGVDPSNCVVIEDAVAGVQAARAAGGSPVASCVLAAAAAWLLGLQGLTVWSVTMGL